MKIKTLNLVIFLTLLAAISGCASASPKRELMDVQKDIERRTDKRLDYDISTRNESTVEKELRGFLQSPLSTDAAVKIALLNNPSLSAAFEELGITKADLVQQGLLKNPSVSGSIREPNHDGKTNTEFEVTQDVLSLLTLPLRKRLTGLQLEEAKYALGEEILHLESEVRGAYYALQAAQQMTAMQEKILKGEEAAVELAQRQLAAGNINDLVLAGHRLALTQAQMDLKEKQTEVKEAREHLGRLMGLTNKQLDWNIHDTLPFVSQEEPPLEELEAKARMMNLDLLMAKQKVRVMEDNLKVSRIHLLPEIHAGFNTEKETDGGRLEGPVFEVEVPLFDQKQSTVARSKAELKQAKALLKAKEDEVISEVRSKYARLVAKRSMAESYIESALPLHAQLIDSLQKHYNFMLVGVYDLLNAKKEESEAYHNFVETLKEYWILRSELELLTGEKMTYFPAEKMKEDKSPKPTMQEHHNHSQHGGNK